MLWEKGYSASYYMTRVDPVTWRDMEKIHITGGTVKRGISGLMQSADVNCINYPRNVEQWVRIYLDARQNDNAERIPLFTGLAISPDEDAGASVSEMTVQCYSVLKPADDINLLPGWFVSAGTSGAEVIKDLLSASPAPVTVEGTSPLINTTIIAEGGETRLTMAQRVLSAINWNMRIEGDGSVHLRPYDTASRETFDPVRYDVIEGSIKIASDFFSVPNVYMAISGDLTAIARDDDPKSPFSTENRGREIWKTESDCEYSEKETIADYAIRKLKEAQRQGREASYDRRFVDGVFPFDVIRLHYPKQKLDGLFIVTSQSIRLGYNATTSEKVLEV